MSSHEGGYHAYQYLIPAVEAGLEGCYRFKKGACIYPVNHSFLLSEIISEDGLIAQRLEERKGRRHKFVLLSDVVVYPYVFQHPVKLLKGQKFLAYSSKGRKIK